MLARTFRFCTRLIVSAMLLPLLCLSARAEPCEQFFEQRIQASLAAGLSLKTSADLTRAAVARAAEAYYKRCVAGQVFSNPRAWVRKVAVNALCNMLRDEAVRTKIETRAYSDLSCWLHTLPSAVVDKPTLEDLTLDTPSFERLQSRELAPFFRMAELADAEFLIKGEPGLVMTAAEKLANELRLEQLRVLYRRGAEGKTAQEIAQVDQLPKTTVEHQLTVGRQAVRDVSGETATLMEKHGWSGKDFWWTTGLLTLVIVLAIGIKRRRKPRQSRDYETVDLYQLYAAAHHQRGTQQLRSRYAGG